MCRLYRRVTGRADGDRLAEIAERTPVTLALRSGIPIATTMRHDETARDEP
jgi:hypothetical protein